MGACYLSSQRWIFIMKKEGLPLAAAQVQPYSGSFAHLTLLPKSEQYYGIPNPWAEWGSPKEY